jgi:cell fate (sporulation/competence/biofilm development) regulator YmcA (YheA/YmcA/DUF963 family)
MKTNLEKRIELYTKIETAENAIKAMELQDDGSIDTQKAIADITTRIGDLIEELNNLPITED